MGGIRKYQKYLVNRRIVFISDGLPVNVSNHDAGTIA